jgi:hypothetical protein
MNSLKICALATCLVFSAHVAAVSASPLAYRLRVDEKKGTVKERWMPEARGTGTADQDVSGEDREPRLTLIVIEDAHTSLQAQQNIAGILDEIIPQLAQRSDHRSDSRAPVLIGIEGAAGEIETASVRTFPFQKTKQTVLDYYCSVGRLSGAERYALSADEEHVLFGI